MSIPPIIYAFIAALAFSGLNASVGYLSNVLGIPVTQVILLRNSSVLIFALTYLLFRREPDAPLGPPAARGAMILGGVAIAISIFTGYCSMFYLTLSEYITVMCMDPFVTAVLCRLLGKDRITKTQLVCCLISVVGIVFVTDPFASFGVEMGDGEEGLPVGQLPTGLRAKLFGLLLCVPSILGQAVQLIAMREVGDQVAAAQILVYLAFCPAVMAPMLLAATRTSLIAPDTTQGWLVFLGVIPLGLTGQCCLAYTGQRVSAIQVSIALYSGVVFGTLIQWMIYGNHPSLLAARGMVMIVICGVYAAIHGTDEEERSLSIVIEGDNEDTNLLLTASSTLSP